MEFNSITDFRSNFTQVYHKEVSPKLQGFEGERGKVKLICNIVWIIAIIICALVGFYAYKIADMDILGFVILPLLLGAAITGFLSKNFETKLKKAVMPIAMKAFGDFVWTNASVIDKYTLKETRLFDRFENKTDDDSFYGTYHGLHININETRLTYTTRDSDGHRHTHTEFKGVIAQIDFNKSFKGHTIIRKREFLNSKVYDEIKLEDPEFSKMYFVDGSDQVESRYILTTSFIERFKNVKKAFGALGIEASLKDNKILIAISTSKDMFKLGNINKPVNDTKQFNELLNEFLSILAIVDELKLNQNIGL